MGRTFVIAEAGSTHDRNLDNCIRLIDAAKACGADAIKFQWTSNAKKMAERRNAPELAEKYSHYLGYPQEWLGKMKAHADVFGIEIFWTGYVHHDLCALLPYQKRAKIASLEHHDEDMVNLARCHYGSENLIISLGACKEETHHGYGAKLLHCVSGYPTPLAELNLRAIRGTHGLSDHGGSTMTGALAVAAGAEIVEAHIRLNDTNPMNPDYLHSHRADGVPFPEFAAYVENIRRAEEMMGDGTKRVMPCEEPMLKYRVNP